jgi:hypothetical protein
MISRTLVVTVASNHPTKSNDSLVSPVSWISHENKYLGWDGEILILGSSHIATAAGGGG